MNRTLWMVVAALLAVVLVWIASRPGAPLPMQPDEVEIAVYEVPIDRAREIDSAIGGILRFGKQELGSSRLAGRNQIMVLAPASVQAGIQKVLLQLGAGDVPALRAKQPLTLRAWLLRSSSSPSDDPALKAIAAQTAALKEELGVAGFEQLDSLRISLAGDADASHLDTPRGTSVRARALTDGEGYVVDFQLHRVSAPNSGLNTRASMTVGQTLILSTVSGIAKDQSEVVILRLEQPSA